jgi:hypothetical protein
MPLNPRPGNPFHYYHLPKLVFPSVLFLSIFPQHNLYRRFLFPIHAIRPAQFILLIWSTEQHLVMNIDHKAPHYTVCSTPVLPRPSWTQMSSSAPYSRTSSPYIPLSMKNDEISHPFKQQASIKFWISSTIYFWKGKLEEIIFSRNDRYLLWYQSAFNIFLNGVFIYLERTKLFELFHKFKENLSYIK